MKNYPAADDPFSSFIAFTHEMWVNVRKVSISVTHLEMTYKDLAREVINLSTARDVKASDNVIRQALMERILSRDIDALLASTLRLKELLMSSIRILIKDGEEALSNKQLKTAAEAAENHELGSAVARLKRNLDLFRKMLYRLSLIGECKEPKV